MPVELSQQQRSARTSARLRSGLGVVLIGALLAGLFWSVLFAGETFSDRDLAAYYRPAKALVAPLTRASEGVPLWNPFFASGQPFASNPEHAIFYPLTTLFLLLPFELAFRLQVIVPLFLCLGSMYALARTLRRSREASLFAALAWAFGGYVLSTTNLLPLLFTVSTMPLTLALVLRLMRVPRLVYVSALGLSMGLECLAAEPSTLLITWLLCVPAVLSMWRRRAPRGLAAVVAGLGLGMAVGAVALFPGIHHAGKTQRLAGLSEMHTADWSMPAARAIDLVFPGSLGHVIPGDETAYLGRKLYGKRESPYFFSLYPGLAVTLLGFLAWRVRMRALLPWAAVAVFGFLLAMGDHFVVWPLVRHLPVFRSLRFPEKYALMFVFPLAIVAVFGFDAVVMGGRKLRASAMVVLLAWAGLAVVGALTLALVGRCLQFSWQALTVDALRVALVAALLAVVLMARWRWRRRTRAAAVCAVLALDLLTSGRLLVHTSPVQSLAAPPAAFEPLLRHPSDDLLFHAAEWHTVLGQAAGLAKPPLPAQWGIATTLENDFDLTFLRRTDEGTHTFWKVVHRNPMLIMPLLQRRGVTAVAQFEPGSQWQNGYAVSPSGGSPLQVAPVLEPQPLLFAASHVAIVGGNNGWGNAVLNATTPLQKTAFVDSESLADFSVSPSPADVRVVTRKPGSLTATVDSAGPAPSFIAFNQTWDEGWTLTIDGVTAPLVRSEIALSGFVSPPGKHVVSIVYRDRWIMSSAWVSVFALLLCLALVVVGRRSQSQATALTFAVRGPGSDLR